MSDINSFLALENPRDVILFLTRADKCISYPALDRLYSNNQWVHIGNNLELLRLVDAMESEGLIEHTGGGLRKGPRWKAPTLRSKKTLD